MFGDRSEAPDADVIIVEMGVPDIGDFPHHHRPSDVVKLRKESPCENSRDSQLLFCEGSSREFQMPVLPETIYQLEF